MNQVRLFSGFLKTNITLQILAILTLLVSALAPQGFMPTQTANGFAIKLCSGHADNKLTITRDHPDYDLLALVYGPQEQPKSEPETTAPACAFAANSVVGLASIGPVIALAIIAPATHQPTAARRFALRHRINTPPATGPPVLV